ncbi:hypothetical protein FRZ59_00015 [Anseongella ginsenosidimutans]|nr:hypothetical protein FRZ59_00015 [Anseongella ginsenosidimutans]
MIIVLLLAQSINVASGYTIYGKENREKDPGLPEITPFRKAEYENAAERKTFVEELLNTKEKLSVCDYSIPGFLARSGHFLPVCLFSATPLITRT